MSLRTEKMSEIISETLTKMPLNLMVLVMASALAGADGHAVENGQIIGAKMEALHQLADEFASVGDKEKFGQAMEQIHSLQKNWEVTGRVSPSADLVNQALDAQRAALNQKKSPTPVDTQAPQYISDHEFNGSHIGPREIVLTFDDGPHATLTKAVEEVLARNHAPAAFFEIGENVQALPQWSKYLSQKGYVVANHSWSHPQLTKLSADDVKKQITRTQRMIQLALGGPVAFNDYFQFYFGRFFNFPRNLWAPEFMRSPYGDKNSRTLQQIVSTGAGASSQNGVARKITLNHIMWNIDSLDWHDPSPAGIEKRVFAQLGLENHHGIILFHDVHPQTLSAIQLIIPRLQREGYKLITLYDMLQEKNLSINSSRR